MFFVASVQASAPYAADAGCLVMDISSIFAIEQEIPLVVPGVNDDVLADYRNSNMVVVDCLNQSITAGGKTPYLLGRPEPSARQHDVVRGHSR